VVGLSRPSGVHGFRLEGTVGGVLSMVMVSALLSDESPGACRLEEEALSFGEASP
jgi:hypothetical protein